MQSNETRAGSSSPQFDVVREVVRVLEVEASALTRRAQVLSSETDSAESVRRALSLMESALQRGGKIVVTGVGKSGKIAQKTVATLCSTGSFAVFLHPTEGLHGDLGVVQPGDVVLALSYTGNTDELTRILPSLKSLQVPVIGLGGNARSKLAAACDVWLDAPVEQEACPHNLAPTTSTTLALALCDALAVTLMQLRGFDAGAFARNHPGGSIGNRLKLQVAEVMHSGEAIPCVTPQALMDEVVVVSTRHKLGAVLVMDGAGMLMGIITDGDLRRALQHREKFFSLQAKEVMTRGPVTAQPEMMAYDALKLMENRPSQISVLPVVNSEGRGLGLVRLHDLIGSL